MVGIEIITPYLTKSKKENLTSLCFNIDIHIIPANAPNGVNIAPMLLPMIEAYTAFIFSAPLLIISVNKTDIGILLTRFEPIKDDAPYDQTESPVVKKLLRLFVIPDSLSPKTIMNILKRNGIRLYGSLINELVAILKSLQIAE